jgi:hypothetical protein
MFEFGTRFCRKNRVEEARIGDAFRNALKGARESAGLGVVGVGKKRNLWRDFISISL